ncbi:MAG: hypothetical protein ACW990_02325 [Promethearchaeota archaeon]|jgi:hypothetical protein
MTINVDIKENRTVSALSEEFRLGGGQVQRIVSCAWEDRIQLVREVLGWFDSGVYHYPDLYDTDINDDVPGLYADRVRIVPADEDRVRAKVTIIYKTQDIELGGPGTPSYSEDGVWITESLDSVTEFLTYDRKGLGFGTGTERVSLDNEDLEPPAALNFMIDWVYTLNHLPTWDIAMFNIVGKVNDAPVYSRALNITFPEETLLCLPPVSEREISWNGTYMWNVTYRFRYKNLGTIALPIGWNWFPNMKKSDANGIAFNQFTNEDDEVIPIHTTFDFSGVIR